MVPSIKQESEKKTARNEAIADAFDSIVGEAYSDDWIQVADWFRIICTECVLIPNKINFTAKDVHSSLKVRFDLATATHD
jgi:hypothetical protein